MTALFIMLHFRVFPQVERSFGDLSNVTVYWEADPSSEEELLSRSGNITFGVGETLANITITVAQDEIPELDKNFTVSLVNVSHGRLGEQTSATLTVLASDDPYGVFIFANVTRSVKLPESDSTVSLTILRQRGLMGQVCPTVQEFKAICRGITNSKLLPPICPLSYLFLFIFPGSSYI